MPYHMLYKNEFDELFTHLCWKYGLDSYETDGAELEKHCTESEFKQLISIWDPSYDD